MSSDVVCDKASIVGDKIKGTPCITEATSMRELKMGHFLRRTTGIICTCNLQKFPQGY
jgi:hypothetical protein